MLNNFIRIGRLCEFIEEIIPMISEARAWEFWLHKNTGRSWDDFRLSVIPQEVDENNLQAASEDVTRTFMKGVLL